MIGQGKNYLRIDHVVKMIQKLFVYLVVLLWICFLDNVFAQTKPDTSITQIPNIELELVATGFKSPVGLISQPGFQDRLLVVEQEGRIVAIDGDKRSQADPFLDISSKIDSGGEKGLLGFVFDPDFRKNSKFYLNYTKSVDKTLQTIISELKISPATGKPDLEAEQVILKINQPYANHNGGQLAFGADKMLYIGLGDGGGVLDPENNGQNISTFLGSILRIDVNSGKPYLPPVNNPFVENQKGLPEIWAYGFRNPWRFSFDRLTGALWVGDVGQDEREEIDLVERGGNYGWNVLEGSNCLKMKFQCKNPNYIAPIIEYNHEQGKSVVGGFVYRGEKFPKLQGIYFYGDFVSGKIWGLKFENNKIIADKELLKTELAISSFGQDLAGELYVVNYSKGEIYRIIEK